MSILIFLLIVNILLIISNLILLAAVANSVYQIRQFALAIFNFSKSIKILIKDNGVAEIDPRLWSISNYGNAFIVDDEDK